MTRYQKEFYILVDINYYISDNIYIRYIWNVSQSHFCNHTLFHNPNVYLWVWSDHSQKITMWKQVLCWRINTYGVSVGLRNPSSVLLSKLLSINTCISGHLCKVLFFQMTSQIIPIKCQANMAHLPWQTFIKPTICQRHVILQESKGLLTNRVIPPKTLAKRAFMLCFANTHLQTHILLNFIVEHFSE